MLAGRVRRVGDVPASMGSIKNTPWKYSGLCVIIVFVVVELKLHSTWLAEGVEVASYYLLSSVRRPQTQGPDRAPPPVTIIDIGEIGRKDDKVLKKITARQPLAAVLKRIRGMNPVAVGIDIDFSPVLIKTAGVDDYYFPDEDLDLVNEIMLFERDKIPIYVGVHRGVGAGPAHWWHAREWSGHAAWLGISAGREYQISLRLRHPGWGGTELPGLAAKLATHLKPFGQNSPLAFFESERSVGAGSFGMEVALADLNMVASFMHTEIACGADGSIPDTALPRERVSGHVVLLGDVRQPTDSTRPVGLRIDVPGVVLHAAHVASLTDSQLKVVPHMRGTLCGAGVLFLGWLIHVAMLHGRGLKTDVLFTIGFSLAWAAAAVLASIAMALNGLFWMEVLMVVGFAVLHGLVDTVLVVVASTAAPEADGHARGEA